MSTTVTVVDQIAEVVGQAMRQAVNANTASFDAKRLATEAADAEAGTREDLYVSLAKASAAHKWTKPDIAKAVTAAAKAGTNTAKDKAIQSFATDARIVMDPAVCAQVEHIRTLKDSAWDAEAADKDAGTPLKDAFARRQHALIECVKAARDGTKLADEADIVNLAQYVVWKRSVDPKVAHKEVTKALENLRAVFGRFNQPELRDAIGALNQVSEESLGEHVRDMADPDTREEAPAPAHVETRPAAAAVPRNPPAPVAPRPQPSFGGKAPQPKPPVEVLAEAA